VLKAIFVPCIYFLKIFRKKEEKKELCRIISNKGKIGFVKFIIILFCPV